MINDDDIGARGSLARDLEQLGYEPMQATDSREALRLFVHEVPDVAITELGMSPEAGLEFLKRAKQIRSDTPIIVLTTQASEENLLKTLRLGARDFLRKSVDASTIDDAIRNALNHGEQKPIAAEESRSIIGHSPSMRVLQSKIQKISKAGRSTVLILGESGTGKELVAHELHRESGRTGAFVPVNCAISDGGLIENSLFGHERGAFTDAKTREKGLLEYAHGGTLFLDEIGEMPSDVQAKLLRFLETGTFRRIGGHEQITVETRVIAATHRNLRDMVSQGRFREDLFFRLNVLPIAVPPLRERGSDLFLLAEYFIRRAAAHLGQPPPPISDNAKRQLAQHDWPGNVRELKNMMERFVLLQEGLTVDIQDLPIEVFNVEPLSSTAESTAVLASAITTGAELQPSAADSLGPPDDYLGVPYADARRRFEVDYFRYLLENHRGNVASVARASGLDPSNVRRMLRRLELDAREYRSNQ